MKTVNLSSVIFQSDVKCAKTLFSSHFLHSSTELVETKIEEFLVSFGEKMSSLSDEAFKTQVTALVKLKGCEDTHLGEEVDRN